MEPIFPIADWVGDTRPTPFAADALPSRARCGHHCHHIILSASPICPLLQRGGDDKREWKEVRADLRTSLATCVTLR